MPYRRSGSGIYYIRVRGVRQSAGTADRQDATALEARLNAEAWRESKLDRKPARTWRELVVAWSQARSGKASWKDDVSRLRWWHDHLGECADIRTITRKTVNRALRDFRGAGDQPSSANATANRYAALVGAMLNYAAHELEWTDAAPRMPHYPERAGEDLWLTVDQWHKLRDELPAHLVGPATFALATGLRQGKVLDLQWSQVNLAGRWMQFHGTDNKRGNTIPLNDTAMTALQAARGGKIVHATHVFTYRGAPIRKPKLGWYAALQRAGLGDWEEGEWRGFRWHGLRHTFNSWLGQHGAPEEIRKRLCGWSGGRRPQSSIVQRYTHFDLEHLRPYAAVVDELLSAARQKREATQ